MRALSRLGRGGAAASPRSRPGIEAALDQLAGLVEGVLAERKFPFVLGGEHSLTPGAIRPIAARHPGLVVLQFDAHADLRDGYQGERYSHAAAMRRVLDLPGVSLVAVGIRAVSTEEVEFYEANRDRIAIHWAKDQARWDIEEIVAPLQRAPGLRHLRHRRARRVGDAGDGYANARRARLLARRWASCAAPARPQVRWLAPISSSSRPIPGLHAYDYTAAALAYKMLAYALAKR